MQIHYYMEGSIIVAEGEANKDCFVLLEGEAQLIDNQCYTMIKILERGDYFGELAAVNDI